MGGLLPLGQIGGMYRGGSEIGALWHGGAEIWRRKPALNNTGLDPTTAKIMVAGGGQSYSWLFDYRLGAGRHAWSKTFRPTYTDTFRGYGNDIPDGLPGLGNGTAAGADNATPQLWAYGNYPANNNPRTDLANFDAFTLWEQSRNTSNIYPMFNFFDSVYPWDSPNAIPAQIEADYQFALAFAQTGKTKMYLVEAVATHNAYGGWGAAEQTDWSRDNRNNIRANQERLLYLKHRLAVAGYPNMELYIIPVATLAAAIQAQYVAGTIPAEVLAYEADVRNLMFGFDDYTPSDLHAYLLSPFGVYMSWCAAYAVWFAQSPEGLGNTESFQNHTIPPNIAAWVQSLAWDVALAHPYCGLGTPLPDAQAWEPYQSEPLADMLPFASSALCAINSPKQDPSGGAVTNGEEVAQIADFLRDGTGPVFQTNELLFTVDDRMNQSLATKGHTAESGVLLFSLANVPAETGGRNSIISFATSGFYVFVERGSGVSRIGTKVPTYTGDSVVVPEAWFDGRPLLLTWNIRNRPERSGFILRDVTAETFTDQNILHGIYHRDWPVIANGTQAQLGAAFDSLPEAPFELHLLAAATEIHPKDYIKIFGYIQSNYGFNVWQPSILFGS